MYWYFIYDRLNNKEKIIHYFNQQSKTKAFVPMIEKWFGCKSVKNYLTKELYPHYILVQSNLDENEFLEKHKEFLKNIDTIANLLQQGDIHKMSKSEQEVYEKVFNQHETIYHSTGNLVNSKLIVEQGPLKGLEDYVGKINRHKRDCFFILNGIQIKMPLEVISKS